MIGFPLVIADSEPDMPKIEPGPLGWHTSTLTTELQEVMLSMESVMGKGMPDHSFC